MDFRYLIINRAPKSSYCLITIPWNKDITIIKNTEENFTHFFVWIFLSSPLDDIPFYTRLDMIRV